MRSLIALLKKNPVTAQLLFQLKFWLGKNNLHDHGQGNVLQAHDSTLRHCSITFRGNNNRVVIEPDCALHGCSIQMLGDGHLLHLGRRVVVHHSKFHFEDKDCEIRLGYRANINANCKISAAEEGRKVILGERCLFANDIDVRTTDSHSIIDLNTGQRINPGADVVLEDRVWVGAFVKILKGVTVGQGSIVGSSSVLNRSIPAKSLAVGVPARVVKEQVSWLNPRIEGPLTTEQRQMLGL